MCDQQELAHAAEALQHIHIALHVPTIKGRVHLVQYDERRRLHRQQCKQEGASAKRSLATTQQLQSLALLAGNGDFDLNATGEDALGLVE